MDCVSWSTKLDIQLLQAVLGPRRIAEEGALSGQVLGWGGEDLIPVSDALEPGFRQGAAEQQGLAGRAGWKNAP